jgi:hypothetical protein
MKGGKIPDIPDRRQQWRTRRRDYKEKGEKRRMKAGFVLGCYHLGIDFPFFLCTSSSFHYREDVTAKKTIRNTSEEVLRIKLSTKNREKWQEIDE